ncbi:RAMP4 family protein [Aspergillus alliaceus]|uniref:RAMP4 family protein n=1 Tax=Petromyces alliaceus TaxID=209559 RepID=UPI0012A40593|nr:uncharacterized protein BDW43DRAFT_105079 [Aspergillus alliaceus]KAB8232511.1 hypothetical protein BDW43DRAFT_105079 [Aspergillus alliaceus]
MAQTPQQRKANEKYAKSEAAKRGKGKTITKQKQNMKSPVSIGWVGVVNSCSCLCCLWRACIRGSESCSRVMVGCSHDVQPHAGINSCQTVATEKKHVIATRVLGYLI